MYCTILDLTDFMENQDAIHLNVLSLTHYEENDSVCIAMNIFKSDM